MVSEKEGMLRQLKEESPVKERQQVGRERQGLRKQRPKREREQPQEREQKRKKKITTSGEGERARIGLGGHGPHWQELASQANGERVRQSE